MHTALIPEADEAVQSTLANALAIAKREGCCEYNVVKIREDCGSVTFLDYANFLEDGFPLLKQYWTVDIENDSCRYRSYQDSQNPPVLHRKELLVPRNHPQFAEFQELTKAAESVGLFDDTTTIGFYQPWMSKLATKGFRVLGNTLLPIGNVEDDNEVVEQHFANVEIARHRTALSRSNFSAPVQLLERLGFFTQNKSVFDYGCGKGDDLTGLSKNGIEAHGWDPHFAPDQPKLTAAIVNLGFVINVIERADERRDALISAYQLAEELLVVSVMLKHLEHDRGRPFNDGVLTGRGTFQRYYSQDEIISYVAATLGEDPIPVAPGIVFVFKDKDEEQRFLSRRAQRRRSIFNPLARRALPRIPPEQRRSERFQRTYEEHKELLDALWVTWLELGRLPEEGELSVLEEIVTRMGSLKKGCNILLATKGQEAEQAVRSAGDSRANEIALYLAKLQFQRRTPYKRLEEGLQRDIKALYGNYKAAQSAGLALLQQIADTDAILNACLEAEKSGLGWKDSEDALTLHTSLIDRLPPLLRCYIECGLRLYGEASNADLLKIHTHSGKLTLMEYDDFENSPLPKMISRTKILLRKQSIEFYDYGEEFPQPYLYYKSRYINEEFSSYEQQQAFESVLEAIVPNVALGYGPSALELDKSLLDKRYEINGMRIERGHTIPHLDDQCGRYFKYRDFIECGETQKKTKLPNLPKNPQSYTALYDLATSVLDPIIDYYGMIKLTYGFCSHELCRKIDKRVAPKLDQHCSFEKNSKGKYICEKGGAAVDFIVCDEDSLSVARWIQQNISFDKLYVYGADKPLHISFNHPQDNKTYLIKRESGRSMPRRWI